MKRIARAAAIFVVAIVMAGCTTVVDGKPTASGTNPFEVGGKPVTEGPSGLRSGAPGPLRDVVNGDGGEIDRLAQFSIADIEEFWRKSFGPPLTGKFAPVDALFSYDSRFKHGTFCGDDTEDEPNLMYCSGRSKNCSAAMTCSPSYNTIGWDRGIYVPRDRELFGEMMIPLDLAHEYGHAISAMADEPVTGTAETYLVGEQQADCFSGLYLKWVADGNSRRFTLSTGEALDKLLASQISVRDSLLGVGDPRQAMMVHGSAFERVTAFQMGFAADGLQQCAAIDIPEIERRRGDLPPELLEDGQTGEYPITRDSVTALVDTLKTLFPPASAPKLAFEQASCGDSKSTSPASFCPSTNTIAVDLNRMVLMGTSLTRGSPFVDKFKAPLFGDYTAYSVLVSRYMLAVQAGKGDMALDTVEAGLRTACLTGAATKKLALPSSQLRLYAGDVDEAVTGVLTNGLVASDVNGDYAPAGFARVDAFRTGVLSGESKCFSRWP